MHIIQLRHQENMDELDSSQVLPSQFRHSRVVIIDALSRIQQKQLLNDGEAYTTKKIIVLLCRELGVVELEASADVVRRIEFATLLFQFIVNDFTIAHSLKYILTRLQIPYCKLALFDDGFFQNIQHPAILLINLIAESCIGCSDEDVMADVELTSQLENLVEQIQTEFVNDESIFENALQQLRQYLKQANIKINAIEQRVQKAEHDKASAELADRAVSVAIQRIKGASTVPAYIECFLDECWYKVLFLTRLRQSETQYWLHHVELARSLIALPQYASKHELQSSMAQLFHQMRHAAATVGYDGYLLNQHLEQLESNLLGMDSFDIRASIEQKTAAAIRVAPKALLFGDSTETNLRSNAVLNPLPDLNKVIASFRFERTEDPRALACVEGITVGTWFALMLADELESIRVKLTTRVELIDKWVFVNRLGVKVLQLDTAQVAHLMFTGHANVLDTGELFARALEKVITYIQLNHEKAPTSIER